LNSLDETKKQLEDAMSLIKDPSAVSELKSQAFYYIIVLFIAGGICFAFGIGLVICFGYSMVKLSKEARKRMSN
jgi:flagellar biosynthesis protein FliP